VTRGRKRKVVDIGEEISGPSNAAQPARKRRGKAAHTNTVDPLLLLNLTRRHPDAKHFLRRRKVGPPPQLPMSGFSCGHS
jgi:hypothetical protein